MLESSRKQILAGVHLRQLHHLQRSTILWVYAHLVVDFTPSLVNNLDSDPLSCLLARCSFDDCKTPLPQHWSTPCRVRKIAQARLKDKAHQYRSRLRSGRQPLVCTVYVSDISLLPDFPQKWHILYARPSPGFQQFPFYWSCNSTTGRTSRGLSPQSHARLPGLDADPTPVSSYCYPLSAGQSTRVGRRFSLCKTCVT